MRDGKRQSKRTITSPVEYSYGTHPLQCLDVYAHPGHARRPTTVLVHGGGFARGDKRQPLGTILFERIRDVLFASGRHVVSLNYRLAADTLNNPPQHPYDDKWPAAIEDVSEAMVWLRTHREKLGITWPLAVIGESAGGNLAAELAFNPALEARAVVTICSYTDLVNAVAPAITSIATNYIGCSLDTCPVKWDAASPARHAQRTVPMLLWQGADDPTVEPAQVFALATAGANAAGSGTPAPCTVQLIAGAGHTGLVGFGDRVRVAELLAFLSRHDAVSDDPGETAVDSRSDRSTPAA